MDESRIVVDVTLDLPSFPEPVAGRLISIPEHPQSTDLCSLFLRKGRFIEPQRDDEVLASEGFMKAHKLNLNDELAAVINGKKKKLRIVGVARKVILVGSALRPANPAATFNRLSADPPKKS